MDWEKELADGLKSAGKDNLGTESVDEAMESIARPIALAIKRNSSNILIVGTATCDEINVLVGMSSGDVWAIKDSGIINNPYGMSLDVSAGDLIRFDGEKWELFFHLELTNYITSDVFDYSVKTLRDAIEINSNGIECLDESLGSHLNDSDNPHGVTSDQLNAVSYGIEQELDEAQRKIARDNISVYSKKQIDDFIKNWSGYVVIPYGSSLPAVKDAELGKIYLVQKTNDPDIKDKYEEWVSDGNAWSLIGDMSIDLSGYVRFDNIADSSTYGVVKSSDSDGKVSVDSSGVMSVNGWNDKADDSSVVHTSGDETISGKKTFNGIIVAGDNIYIPENKKLFFQNNGEGNAFLTLSGTNATTERHDLTLPNKNGTLAIDSEVVHKSGSETITGGKTFAAATVFDKLIYCKPGEGIMIENGTGKGTCRITSNTSTTEANQYQVKVPAKAGTLAVDSDVVHKTGNETIAGTKTFSETVIVEKTGEAEVQVAGNAGRFAISSKNNGDSRGLYDYPTSNWVLRGDSSGKFVLRLRNSSGKITQIEPPSTNTGHNTIAFPPVSGTLALTSDISTAIEGLDVSEAGGDGKYIQKIKEEDGKISATVANMPTSLPASDVKDWAKADNKPTYSWSEIQSKPTSYPPTSHDHGVMKNNGTQNYTSGSGARILNGTNIDEPPSAGYLWHDAFAFGRGEPRWPKYYTSADGESFTEGTLNKTPFINKNADVVTVLNSSNYAARWVWDYGAWSSASVLMIGVAYTNPSVDNYSISFESSADGVEWTSRYYQIVNASTCVLQCRINPYNGDGHLRLTISKTDQTTRMNGSIAITTIKLLTTRWGNQGKGKEIEVPYNWDGDCNILPVNGGSSNLGSASTKWDNVYANNFNGTADKATKDSDGNQINTTYLKKNADLSSGATKCKITYDKKGLVTAGADLAATDIPSLDASKITSGTFGDTRIESASTWHGKQNALPTTGSASSTYAINVSGTSYIAKSLTQKQKDSAASFVDITDDFVNNAVTYVYNVNSAGYGEIKVGTLGGVSRTRFISFPNGGQLKFTNNSGSVRYFKCWDGGHNISANSSYTMDIEKGAIVAFGGNEGSGYFVLTNENAKTAKKMSRGYGDENSPIYIQADGTPAVCTSPGTSIENAKYAQIARGINSYATTTDKTYYLVFVDNGGTSATGSYDNYIRTTDSNSSRAVTINPSTGTLSAHLFDGPATSLNDSGSKVYLKWSDPDIEKVSPSGSDSISHTRYLAAWEKTSNNSSPTVNAVKAANVTVGNADKVDGYHISAPSGYDTIVFL